MRASSIKAVLPPSIGRALRELDIVWIGAHSPQVKGLRVAGAKTLEQANVYLETEFIVWWNNTIAAVPASLAEIRTFLPGVDTKSETACPDPKKVIAF
jgi:hypothetical protein